MGVISIRVNENEEKIIKKYVETKGKSVSQYVKDFIMEAIEDEYDTKICEEYLSRKEAGTLKLFSHEEVLKELNL